MNPQFYISKLLLLSRSVRSNSESTLLLVRYFTNDRNDNNNNYSYRDRDRRRMYNNNTNTNTEPSRRNTTINPSITRDFFPSHGDNPSLSRDRNPVRPQRQRLQEGNDFLEKFKLGFDKEENKKELNTKQEEREVAVERETPPQGADEIFKKMKETGLIPNAVAMLDGLCKDGLVQEAMKLFGLMREKGTIPEVVIYTAVVDGFCKAQKLDDALRIFRKMQSNSIVPNAFSYTVLVQGLCKGDRFEDALEICLEMLETGHSPNLVTFVGLVDGFCREKGVEEGKAVISTLREKGFVCDEKSVRQYLDKKGPSLPLVWEALFGKSSLNGSF